MTPPTTPLARACAAALACLVPCAAQALVADHYELEVRPDFATQRIAGHARIRLKAEPRAASTSTAIDLPAPNLQITNPRLDGREVVIEKTPGGWRIALTETQANAAEAWLELDYEAPAAEGLLFGDRYVHTAFHTCQWMPCAGGDLTRATVAIDLVLPPGDKAVASGETVDASGWRWRQAQPYPLYTLGFAAGRFDEWRDPAEPRLRALGAATDAVGLRARFKESARVLAFFEAKAGVALPPSVYTQVLVPGGAAQEMSSFAVIGHDTLDPIVETPDEDWVIAHEMAHQWWGNLVTCASWSEFWLNEGITVFMTAAWKQSRWGEAEYQRELDLARQRWQRAKDAGFDKPLAWPGEYPSLRWRRAVQYSKGALFIAALRDDLGEAVFWAGLARYTRDNAGRAVRSSDLQAAMEASAGRSLQPLFDRWVF
jgi:aminopeptidase N